MAAMHCRDELFVGLGFSMSVGDGSRFTEQQFPQPAAPLAHRRELGARRTASYTPAANSELVALPHTVATVLGSFTAIPSETHASLMNTTCRRERVRIFFCFCFLEFVTPRKETEERDGEREKEGEDSFLFLFLYYVLILILIIILLY